MILHEFSHLFFGYITSLGDTRHLEQRVLPAKYADRGHSRKLSPGRSEPAPSRFSALSSSTEPWTRSIRALLVGPRFEPIELTALYGAAVVLLESCGIRGRLWLMGGRGNTDCPQTTCPIKLRPDDLTVLLDQAALRLRGQYDSRYARHRPADRPDR